MNDSSFAANYKLKTGCIYKSRKINQITYAPANSLAQMIILDEYKSAKQLINHLLHVRYMADYLIGSKNIYCFLEVAKN